MLNVVLAGFLESFFCALEQGLFLLLTFEMWYFLLRLDVEFQTVLMVVHVYIARIPFLRLDTQFVHRNIRLNHRCSKSFFRIKQLF